MARDDYYMGSLAGLDAYRGDEPAWPPAPPTYPGMKEWGNIDLNARPTVRNPDGSISTVRSMGVNIDNAETLIPTVHPDGRIMSDEEAIDHYRQTGQHLGRFDTPANSDAYAEALHNQQAEQYVKPHQMGALADTSKTFADYMNELPAREPDTRLLRRAPASITGLPVGVERGIVGAAKGIGDVARVPAALRAPNPHPPGSELADWYDARNKAIAQNWAPEVAQMLMGAGTFGGVKPLQGAGIVRDSRNANLYNPPIKSPRVFEKDYPEGARADAGNLTHDIEGRRLVAQNIIGRRTLGGADVALSPAELDAAATEILGRPPARVAQNTLPRGSVGAFIDARGTLESGPQRRIDVSRSLPETAADKVMAHEFGHAIDALSGEISTTGLNKDNQLRRLYNTLNTGQERTRHLSGPQHLGYKGEDVPRELMAEAIRAYMADPNYIKTVAPDAAKAIRAAVNSNPRLSKTVQFNVLPFAMAPVGLGALAAQDRYAREEP